jgi:hypothetical protein
LRNLRELLALTSSESGCNVRRLADRGRAIVEGIVMKLEVFLAYGLEVG